MCAESSGWAERPVLRYAQCWEDADVLLEALDPQPGHTCLSIASAGDNTLAILGRGPRRVIAVDLNPVQLACLELRVAAYRALAHGELLELLGSSPSGRRAALFGRCRRLLSPEARRFWDARPGDIARGVGGAGKFERYLALFGRDLLPVIQPRRRMTSLLQPRTSEEREAFYTREWDTWRWRLAFHLFFSRLAMGRLGRNPAFFRQVVGRVASPLLQRTRHALTALSPHDNPYLQWILLGRHETALPFALRPENFDSIREHLDRLEWHCLSLEEFLATWRGEPIDRCNLSDVFEYMPEEGYHRLLERLLRVSSRGTRLAYWNMRVERRRPEAMADRLHPLTDLASRLHRQDKAFFYRDFVLEEVC